MRLTDEQKQQYRQDLPRLALASIQPSGRSGSGKAGKKEKIIRIRKTLSEMTEEQRQAIADKFGIVTVEGHLLTAHNQCFIVAQLASLDPPRQAGGVTGASRSGSEINFSIVGGYKQWQKAGRSVRKGEHGFYIFVPSKTKEESENAAEVSSDDETPFFFTAVVFDISQTELIAEAVLENAN